MGEKCGRGLPLPVFFASSLKPLNRNFHGEHHVENEEWLCSGGVALLRRVPRFSLIKLTPGQSACTYGSRLHPHAAVIHLDVQSQSWCSGTETVWIAALEDISSGFRLAGWQLSAESLWLCRRWGSGWCGRVVRSSSAFEVLGTGKVGDV